MHTGHHLGHESSRCIDLHVYYLLSILCGFQVALTPRKLAKLNFNRGFRAVYCAIPTYLFFTFL
jgi:hypothetical protein